MNKYIRDMEKLKNYIRNGINPASEKIAKAIDEYDAFIVKGCGCIRRTNRHWSGNSTDMTIEQILIRCAKCRRQGITNRGYTSSVENRWILTTPLVNQIIDLMEAYVGLKAVTTDQHVDARDSRISRDTADMLKISSWFNMHDPFPCIEELINIATGTVGGEKFNPYDAFNVGNSIIKNFIGLPFDSIKFQRSMRILPLKAQHNNIKMNGEILPIDPNLLFQRIYTYVYIKKLIQI